MPTQTPSPNPPVVLVPTPLSFGDALQKLATQACKAIRRLGWGMDTSVLLLDEEGFLTIRKPEGTLHKAFICTEDIINGDWVVGE
jgi:hypothetical protein